MRTMGTILLLAVLASLAGADDYLWNTAGNGSYGDPCAWTPNGVPGSSDRALLQLPATSTYTVSFDNDYNTGQLLVDTSDVAFDLGGFTYNLVWTDIIDHAAVVGDLANAKLMVTNGNVYSGRVILGRNGGSFGALQISVDGFWEAKRDPDWQELIIAGAGNADLTVDSGGILRHGHGTAASQVDAHANITVIGGNSQWYVDGYFALGDWGDVDMIVCNEGQARMNRCEMGCNRTSMANAAILGNGENTSEWRLASSSETSLTIGLWGRATVTVGNSGKLLNEGNLDIARYNGSYGALNVQRSWVDIWSSLGVGGSPDEVGGRAVVNLTDNSLMTVGQHNGDRMVIQPLGTVNIDQSELDVLFNGAAQELLVKGRLAGAGMIWADVNQPSGTLAPGVGSAGKVLEIGGDYTQGGAATFEVELGGTEEEVDYGKLYVSNDGVAVLNGMLSVKFVNGFIPQSSSDTFRIVAVPAGFTGTFANANTTYTFSDGAFDVLYDGTSVVLTNFRAEPACLYPPRSDLNGDCKVNLLDLAIMAGEWLDCGLWPSSSCEPVIPTL